MNVITKDRLVSVLDQTPARWLTTDVTSIIASFHGGACVMHRDACPPKDADCSNVVVRCNFCPRVVCNVHLRFVDARFACPGCNRWEKGYDSWIWSSQ